MVGEAGLEPASLAAQDPKSCVSASSTTRPEHCRHWLFRDSREGLLTFVPCLRRHALRSLGEDRTLVSCPANTLSFDWPILDAEGFRRSACIPGTVCARCGVAALRQKRPTPLGRGSSGAQPPRNATTMAWHRLSHFAASVHPEYPRQNSTYLPDRTLGDANHCVHPIARDAREGCRIPMGSFEMDASDVNG